MGVSGLGLVMGWCALGYAKTNTGRGRFAGAVIAFAGLCQAQISVGGIGGLLFLGAGLVGATAHLAIRSLVFARVGSVES